MTRQQPTIMWWVMMAFSLVLAVVCAYAWFTLPTCCYPETIAPVLRIVLGVVAVAGACMAVVLLLRRHGMTRDQQRH